MQVGGCVDDWMTMTVKAAAAGVASGRLGGMQKKNFCWMWMLLALWQLDVSQGFQGFSTPTSLSKTTSPSACQRLNGRSYTDLFTRLNDDDGDWQEATNLAPEIQPFTSNDDKATDADDKKRSLDNANGDAHDNNQQSLILPDAFAILLACQLTGLLDVVNDPQFTQAGGWLQPIPAVPPTLGILVQR
ncbi:MAG: hypothetical protein SGARI_001171, partial [Bacillariaceae sp.]